MVPVFLLDLHLLKIMRTEVEAPNTTRLGQPIRRSPVIRTRTHGLAKDFWAFWAPGCGRTLTLGERCKSRRRVLQAGTSLGVVNLEHRVRLHSPSGPFRSSGVGREIQLQ